MSLPIPTELPIMTLPNVVLFPHAMLPLHIFESRYQQMLEAVLNGNRLFGIATHINNKDQIPTISEKPYPIASIGIIRASQRNDDQTSNLIVQGLSRINIENIVREEPYRIAKVTMLESMPGADEETLSMQRNQLLSLVQARQTLSMDMPDEVMKLLYAIPDPEVCANIACFSICPTIALKQKLLESVETYQQLDSLIQFLIEDNKKLAMEHLISKGLDPENIGLN